MSILAIVTDHGIELYTVVPDKKSLKQLKTISVTVQWFVWCPKNKIAILASSHGSQLQPVVIKQGSVNKLPKVESKCLFPYLFKILLTETPVQVIICKRQQLNTKNKCFDKVNLLMCLTKLNKININREIQE